MLLTMLFAAVASLSLPPLHAKDDAPSKQPARDVFDGIFVGAFQLVRVKPRTVDACVLAHTTYPGLTCKDWVLYACVAPQLTTQDLLHQSLGPAGDPDPGADWKTDEIEENGKGKRRLHRAKVDTRRASSASSLSCRFSMRAALYPVDLQPGEPAEKVKSLSSAEKRLYLRDTPLYDYRTKKMKKWIRESGLKRGGKERDLAYAWRVLSYLVSKYEISTKAAYCYRASDGLTVKRMYAAAVASLFIAVLRANKVPARFLAGRWAIRDKDPKKTPDHYHGRAEFYAKDVGWVPVDPFLAEVAKPPMSLGFGRTVGKFLAFHIEPNIPVDDATGSEFVSNVIVAPLMYPRGSGITNAQPRQEYKWIVEVEGEQPSEAKGSSRESKSPGDKDAPTVK